MSLVNFYKGPESDYLEETHGGGIYQCTDSENTYIFGVKNKSSETEIINLAFTSLPDNGSQHTIDQSNFNKLASALDSNKVIYVRTACNLFVVHSIYDISMYSGAKRSTVFLYFHFNVGSVNSVSSITLEDITRDVNGYITIDMSQTPDESNKYTYTVYTTSPYYVLDKITSIASSDIVSATNSPITLENTYTTDEIENIITLTKNNNTKLVITTSDGFSIIFDRVIECSATSTGNAINYIVYSSESLLIAVGYFNASFKLIIIKDDTNNYQLLVTTFSYSDLVNNNDFNSYKTEVSNKYLSKTNVTPYTPNDSYNPATKYYVDDAINSIPLPGFFTIIINDLPINDEINFQNITIGNVRELIQELSKDRIHIINARNGIYGFISLTNYSFSGAAIGNAYRRVSKIKLSLLFNKNFFIDYSSFKNDEDTYLIYIYIESNEPNGYILDGYTTTVNYKIL